MTYPKLIPLNKWNEMHEYPPLGTLRRWVSDQGHRPPGFEDVACQIGVKWYLDEDAFFNWIETRTKVKRKEGTSDED